MEIIIVPILVIAFICVCFMLMPASECYYCGDRINKDRRPVRLKGKASCEECWIKGDNT